MTNDDPQVADLVAANHILADQGVVDAFGHVSVRSASAPDRFLLSRSMAPGLVGPDDIMLFDLDGQPLDASGPPLFVERFIHSAIYAARPDVNAIVHSHSPSVIPFGVVHTPLRAMFHMSGFLGTGVPVFEVADTGGDETDMLIRNGALGTALAESLGRHAVVLMRGHGSTAVGTSLPQAVFRAVYAEINARIQSDALRLGDPRYLSAGEAESTSRANDSAVSRPWNLWKSEAMRRRA